MIIQHFDPDKFPLFTGYIDPSAGQVFNSMGPIISGFIGIFIGAVTGFLIKFKHLIKSYIQKFFKILKRKK